MTESCTPVRQSSSPLGLRLSGLQNSMTFSRSMTATCLISTLKRRLSSSEDESSLLLRATLSDASAVMKV